MAKKKALYGETNYYKRTHKKRTGNIRKKWGPKRAKPKKNRGQGHGQTSNNMLYIGYERNNEKSNYKSNRH